MVATLDRAPRWFTIGAVAEQVGRSPSTIRKLERAGVVMPLRVEGQDRRLYTLEDVATIRAALAVRSGGTTPRGNAA